MTSTGLLVLLGLVISSGGSGADEHLLAGARHFREARYTEALVEFSVARQVGAPEAARYAAVTLVKLDRPEEAIEAFGGLDGDGPDALIDYYRGVAAFEARLFLAAERLLASVADRAGPRVGKQVARLRAEIARVLQPEPTPAAIDWYLDRLAGARAGGRQALAAAYAQEAAGLSERRQDRYRHAEAARGRGAAKDPGARP